MPKLRASSARCDFYIRSNKEKKMTSAGSRNSGLIGKSLVIILCLVIGTVSAIAQSQVAAADLKGTVVDPNGAVIPGANVTVRNLGTNISRSTTSDANGAYSFVAIPPGDYEITSQASGFKKVSITPLKLAIGQSAELKVTMEVGAQDAVVTVTGDTVELIETTKTTVANTIDKERIDNLPINERSATGFALTISTVGRDNGRPIGPAPTSGLNIGGQRGRSTQVNVDGADFTDNSINAARTTVSQEAVQEYQVTTNSYMPEFGRATGGIVNVVTKSGTNDVHGNLFGFIRHKSIQEKNALAPVIDGDPDKKPPYTRTQYGATIGGPLIKDRNFYFFSFEQRRRQETGFFTSDVIGPLTASANMGQIAIQIPGAPAGTLFVVNPAPITFSRITAAQATFINNTIAAGLAATQNPATFQAGITALCGARTYGYFASSGGTTALNGTNPLPGPTIGPTSPTACPNFSPTTAAGTIGSRFLLTGAPVPLTQVGGEYVAFRPLTALRRTFPISEATTYSSFRMDHMIEPGHQLMMRFSYNPGELNGIQDESQNQVLGQNDYSRTGITKIEDTAIGLSYTASIRGNLVNDLAVNYGNRWSTFDSQIPSVAHQIPGTVFMGSNPFSPVERTESRWQIRDNLTWVRGNHIFKTGADFNWVGVNAKFELNFPALFNFGQNACSNLIPGCTGPAFTAVQSYGLGLPSAWIQGFGDPFSKISNKPMAFYFQDTWKITPKFTLNWGIRYDLEITEEFPPTPFTDPLTGISLTAAEVQTAQDALNVTQGFPQDNNNWAPRVGIAWDVFGNGRTLVRAAGGIFFDHPLLAVAFNSDIADGSQQQQATLLPVGGPAPTTLFNATQVFQGTVIPCPTGGTPGVNCTPGVARSAQYLQGFQRFNPANFTGFGPVLPFTLHVSKDFEYPMAFQGNLGIEQMVGKNMVLTASYITVNAKHLAHPQDVNNINTDNLKENFRRFVGVNPSNTTQAILGVSIPTSAADPRVVACPAGVPAPLCFTNNAATWAAFVPGLIAAPVANLASRVVSPIAANFFRPIGPNYFFINSATSGAVNKALWDTLSAGSVRTPGPITAYGEVNAQLSDGNSTYNALNLELKHRFSNNMQFFATYTWSHSIDDSSDLQTLLKPQDNNNFRNEKGNSLFDQRHRFVFSGLFGLPDSWRGAGGWKGFSYGFMFAPIVEYGSGRPFNILAVGDATGDNNSSNERPSVLADGTLCQTGVDPGCFIGVFPATPNLGRNMGITHDFFSVDLRISRKFAFNDRWSLELIAEVFNMFNRFNEAGANPFYQEVNAWGERAGGGNGRYYSVPTAAYDPRQWQFGMKLSF